MEYWNLICFNKALVKILVKMLTINVIDSQSDILQMYI